jgi:hypothetical protein
MPRYFFHLNYDRPSLDDTGSEFASDAAARVEAVALSAGLLKDSATQFWNSGCFALQVVREDGIEICELTFRDTVTWRLGVLHREDC